MTPWLTTLKAAAERATKGPWVAVDQRFENPTFWIEVDHPEVGNVSIAEVRNGCGEADGLGNAEVNAAYIAACSPERITALLRVVDAVKELCRVSEFNSLNEQWITLREALTDLDKTP